MPITTRSCTPATPPTRASPPGCASDFEAAGGFIANASLDDLVGACEERWRHGHFQCPRRPEIDDQLEAGWRLDREFGRVRPFENPIDERRGPTEQVGVVRGEGHQASGEAELP